METCLPCKVVDVILVRKLHSNELTLIQKYSYYIFLFLCGDFKYKMVTPLWCKSVKYITWVWLTKMLQQIFHPIPVLLVLVLSIELIVHIELPALCLIHPQAKRNFNTGLKVRSCSVE